MIKVGSNTIRRIATQLCLLLLGAPAWVLANDKFPIDILVPQVVLDDLPAFVGDQSVDTFDNFERPGSRRDLIDYILLRRALKLGGIDSAQIRVRPWLGSSYERVLNQLRAGDATLFSNTIWREDIRDGDLRLGASAATINYGDYVAGLYMNPANPKFSQPLDFTQLSAVCSDQWRPDWLALEQLPLKRIYNQINWEQMLKMVYSQRVDFMLIPFSSADDLSQSAIGITLKPLPNIKIALAGSRGWAISRSHRHGKAAEIAIANGLIQLKQKGAVIRAYTAAGVFNPRVANWPVANQTTVAEQLKSKAQ